MTNDDLPNGPPLARTSTTRDRALVGHLTRPPLPRLRTLRDVHTAGAHHYPSPSICAPFFLLTETLALREPPRTVLTPSERPSQRPPSLPAVRPCPRAPFTLDHAKNR